MPLTPEDVHKKTFTPVRLREGYDMGEVDHFLDEVEGELTRLLTENDDLRSTLSTPAQAVPDSSAAGEEADAATEPTSKAESAISTPELPVVRTVPEASNAAARLLEIATQNADQLVGEAKDEADQIIGAARTKSERLETDARTTSERLESDARTRAEQLDSETSERRSQLFGQLEHDKDALTGELEDLRAFEREYRSRLRAYFESQLDALDGKSGEEVPLSPAADDDTPRRLRELLGEEQQS